MRSKKVRKGVYVPDEVDERDPLTLWDVRRHKLEVWPEDTRRLPKGMRSCFADGAKMPSADNPEVAPPVQIAEWYLFCNGAFIVRVHHSWINDKVWVHYAEKAANGYNKGYGHRSSVQSALEEAGKWWPERISPHVAGALEEVLLEEAGAGVVWNNLRDQLMGCTYQGVSYFCSKTQHDLVLSFYPNCTVHLARDLETVDLWGARSVRSCPFTFVDDGTVVAFVMPQRWREA